MSKLIDLIINNNCECIGKVGLDDINKAEKELNIKFSDELIEYISNFGAISYSSREINGLGTNSYLNIVKSTINARNNILNFPYEFAVLEDTGIQNIKILIDEFNKIYEWKDNSCKKIYESLYDFLHDEIFV